MKKSLLLSSILFSALLAGCGDDPIKTVKKSTNKSGETYAQVADSVACKSSTKKWELLKEREDDKLHMIAVGFTCDINDDKIQEAQKDLNALIKEDFEREQKRFQDSEKIYISNVEEWQKKANDYREELINKLKDCQTCIAELGEQSLEDFINSNAKFIQENIKSEYGSVYSVDIPKKLNDVAKAYGEHRRKIDRWEVDKQHDIIYGVREIANCLQREKYAQKKLDEFREKAPKLEDVKINGMNYILEIAWIKEKSVRKDKYTEVVSDQSVKVDFDNSSKVPYEFNSKKYIK